MADKNKKVRDGGSKSCPLSKNQEIKLVIDDLGNDGEGIGHYEGYAVFVKNTVPKDEITAGVMKVKKNYAYARLISIDKPSPDRIQPVCSVASRCGGCELQHMSYEAQLAYKERKVKNCLARIGGYDETYLDRIREPIIGMERPYNYRNKAQFPVQRGNDGSIITGFYAGRSHNIIHISDCHIQMHESNIIVGIVREWMEDYGIEPYNETAHTGIVRHIVTRIGKSTGEIMVCLVVTRRKVAHTYELKDRLMKVEGIRCICLNVNPDKTNRILGDEVYPVYGPLYIEDCIGDIRYRISPLSFYQVNPEQTVRLYNTALEYAGLTGKEVVWDLYCGIGTISLFLARNAGHVLGVEVVPEAIEDAKINSEINNICNTTFLAGQAEDIVTELVANEKYNEIASPDVIVVDPPRKGCDAKLLDTIVNVQPDRIVYVSCDPATLARDVKVLGESGYEIVKYRACDMFGMSGHVETVIKLQRKDM